MGIMCGGIPRARWVLIERVFTERVLIERVFKSRVPKNARHFSESSGIPQRRYGLMPVALPALLLGSFMRYSGSSR